MSKLYFLPSILMMIFIFYMSGDSNSAQKSDFVLTLILKFFNLFSIQPFSKINLNLVSFVIRKFAHVSEYFILTLFFYIGFYKNFKNTLRPNFFLLSLLLSITYSITDEIHQSFIPNRVGSYKDVMIDSIGSILCYFIIKKNNKFNH